MVHIKKKIGEKKNKTKGVKEMWDLKKVGMFVRVISYNARLSRRTKEGRDSGNIEEAAWRTCCSL